VHKDVASMQKIVDAEEEILKSPDYYSRKEKKKNTIWTRMEEYLIGKPQRRHVLVAVNYLIAIQADY
jgi:hypothetical protein